MLGVVIAIEERSRLYFKFGHSPCFPVEAAPDRSVHRPYGLQAVARTPQMMEAGIERATRLLREMNVDSGGDPFNTMHHYDGWVDTLEDDAEFKRPVQSVGYDFIDRQGLIRWASAGKLLDELPRPESLLALI